MAEKMDEQQAPLRASPPFPAVLFVCLWGLFNAGVVAVSFAITYTLISVCTDTCELPSWMFRPVELTDAENAKRSALMLGYIYCSVAQAAAATLALLIPSHRRRIRRALAYVVLAAAVASHCMKARATGILLAADPGFLFLRIVNTTAVVFLAVGDLLGFLALLLGSEE